MNGSIHHGKVLKAIRGHYWVETPEGLYHCYARESVVRKAGGINPIVVGDDVTLEVTDEAKKEGVITELHPRRTKLSRRVSTGTKELEQVVAANVDHLVIVSSVADPPFRPGLIDRYLVAAAKGALHPIICVNKVDLEGVESLRDILDMYRDLGYPVVLTSAKTGQGIEELRDRLRDKTSVFAGHSGVGKSSLLRVLVPGIHVKIGEVNPRTGRGRHTTTAAELVRLPDGGYVIDTPGIRQFSLWDLSEEDVRKFFVEIARYGNGCRFADCSHVVEPGCSVRAALEDGRIHPRRYESFLRLLQEARGEIE
ncbi:MAG: ribosome small subunit-dependent GTPase A [Blastocatellia bacterium]|nr:ribosome small subunit-dependent GTPase A [Blastocatellia bacterium]MCS7157509.1 ribosome small subunit-dependent GTPase A [Blastocatellia bacterium]MCX7752682.1 ribosome small subunit-dependent GTPase A [Blastocatellia bacterium]MDW8168413.1 ribosome small subunit-dependent GTPase A [Acidobacteriota bacterium]MDW8255609.1 ribosome small subunit-dependent GTPase A [Acidobacteriota bacterium]